MSTTPTMAPTGSTESRPSPFIRAEIDAAQGGEEQHQADGRCYAGHDAAGHR